MLMPLLNSSSQHTATPFESAGSWFLVNLIWNEMNCVTFCIDANYFHFISCEHLFDCSLSRIIIHMYGRYLKMHLNGKEKQIN